MPKKQPHILKQKALPNWVTVAAIGIFSIAAGYFAFNSFALQSQPRRPQSNVIKRVYCNRRNKRFCSTTRGIVAPVGTSFKARIRKNPNCPDGAREYWKIGTTRIWRCLVEGA